MAARPTWKGYIKISLVNIPVRVFPATDAAATIIAIALAVGASCYALGYRLGLEEAGCGPEGPWGRPPGPNRRVLRWAGREARRAPGPPAASG